MPTESAAEQFHAGYDAPPARSVDDPGDFATAQERVDAFVEYQARPDIESRSSILARETAQPGSISWNEDGTFTVTSPTTTPTPGS